MSVGSGRLEGLGAGGLHLCLAVWRLRVTLVRKWLLAGDHVPPCAGGNGVVQLHQVAVGR